jgi:hypothetical protein
MSTYRWTSTTSWAASLTVSTRAITTVAGLGPDWSKGPMNDERRGTLVMINMIEMVIVTVTEKKLALLLNAVPQITNLFQNSSLKMGVDQPS